MKAVAPDALTPDIEHICIQGIPFDANSTFRRGPAQAPARIRESYFSDSANLWSEQNLDLAGLDHLVDTGDVNCDGDPLGAIRKATALLLKQNARVISLGGDHSVTLPLIQAHAPLYPELTILHLDAHPDLYDSLDNNPFSHACPFARIMEEFPHIKLIQGGIRTINGHQREQAERFNVRVLEMKNGMDPLMNLDISGPVYLSLDLDCGSDPFSAIQLRVSELLNQGSRLVCLGGDHSITLPIIQAHAAHHP
ncbi:MAG: arginase family protein, partial [Desulfobacterales bacterium]|nr:arginase family protein [Desulfobacterales bacterium]